jgi:hypothetical protein
MNRMLATSLTAVVFSVAATTAAAAPAQTGYVCDRTDMNMMATREYGSLWDTPSALECDFRLFVEYPEPLVWTDAEYFFGGTFWWAEPADVQALGWSDSDVIKYLNQIDQRLFFGKAGTPEAQLKELSLRRGPVFHDADGTIRRQAYYVFKPLEPGLYKWHYEYDDHMWWSDVARGQICIVPAHASQLPSSCS